MRGLATCLVAASAVFATGVQATFDHHSREYYINYTTVTGCFVQDDPATNPSGFDYTKVNFGLINRTYPTDGRDSSGLSQWQRFERQVKDLNRRAPRDTEYKVLFMGRHGEGFHNAAESFYGTPGWNCYWGLLNGNSTTTWADADLTANGVRQAQIANAFWRSRIEEQHIPFPESYYTSPLTRCLRTANITFSDLPLPRRQPFVPTVKEFFREGVSIRTCDRRGSKRSIHGRFPTYRFEPGFTDNDELWNGVSGEPSAAQDIRSKKVLDSVFSTDDATWVSITSHSGEIGSLLRVLKHRAFSLSTGAIIPVLVEAKYYPKSKAPPTSTVPFTTSTHCNSPPITSSEPPGCVCTNGATVTTPIFGPTTTSTPQPNPPAYPPSYRPAYPPSYGN